MRNELQYRSEWCPCSGASADTVELQVSEDPSPTGSNENRFNGEVCHEQ